MADVPFWSDNNADRYACNISALHKIGRFVRTQIFNIQSTNQLTNQPFHFILFSSKEPKGLLQVATKCNMGIDHSSQRTYSAAAYEIIILCSSELNWTSVACVGYDCSANSPCTSANEGSYFRHVVPMMYIACSSGARCNEIHCPPYTLWDHGTSACVSNGF